MPGNPPLAELAGQPMALRARGALGPGHHPLPAGTAAAVAAASAVGTGGDARPQFPASTASLSGHAGHAILRIRGGLCPSVGALPLKTSRHENGEDPPGCAAVERCRLRPTPARDA